MKKLFYSVLLAIYLLPFSTAFAKDPIRTIDGIVTNASDGDSINVQDPLETKVNVCHYGIDAIETDESNNLGQPLNLSQDRNLN